MAEVLGKQPRPSGPRLAIVTNAGGPGALATDMLVSSGGQIAELSPETFQELNQLLPAHWSRNNPVDLLGDADPERYAKALEIVSKDPNNDGILVILTPQAMTECADTARSLQPFAKLNGKPLLASWMGGMEVAEGRKILHGLNIPTFNYPDTAARAFSYMWRYSNNLRSLYETPALASEGEQNRVKVESIITAARQKGRTLLTEAESKAILSGYGIPTVETHVALDIKEAVSIAERIGYPVVLKIYSETIAHKTDVGGVQLNLNNREDVERAFYAIEKSVTEKVGAGHFLGVTVQPMILRDGYELILGSSLDSQFGPVLLFGSGGQLVEILKDHALGLPPLNATLAQRMMECTRIFEALKGVRGREPVDLVALEQLLVRFSHLVVEQPWISEIEINPLLASADQLIALDARVVVHGADVTENQLPHPAVRPYPTQYVTPWIMKDGEPVTLRPIRPEDEPMIVEFHKTLSDRSVHLRYFGQLKLSQRIAHERLIRICFNDYDREIALVVDHQRPDGVHEILGVGRLSKLHGLNEAEFAIVISDDCQGRGLGTQLLKLLVEIGRQEKLKRIIAHILSDNIEMMQVSREIGFKLIREEDEWMAEYVL